MPSKAPTLAGLCAGEPAAQHGVSAARWCPASGLQVSQDTERSSASRACKAVTHHETLGATTPLVVAAREVADTHVQ